MIRSDAGERAVSKVVGVILMIGIVVALAALMSVMFLGFGDTLNDPAPMVAFDAEYHDDVEDPDTFHPDLPSNTNEVLVITHNAGSRFDPSRARLVIRGPTGTLYRESWEDASTGQDGVVGATDALYPHAYGSETLSDKQIQILWFDEDGENGAILLEWSGAEYE